MIKKTTFLILMIFSISFVFPQMNKYSKVKIIASKVEVEQIVKSGVSIENFRFEKNGIVLALPQDKISQIEQLGFEVKVIIDDLSAFYAEQNSDVDFQELRKSLNSKNFNYPVPQNWDYGSMGGYSTLDEIYIHLDTMFSKFPNLITQKEQIGTFTSHEGRELYWVKISDNPTVNEAEPEILYNALHHAREPASVQQLLFYMYYLLENYETDDEIKSLIDNTEMYFVPCINPDGYKYNETTNQNGGGMWRKNRRNNNDGSYGVDLNRNYGYEWGYDNTGSSPEPSSITYRGPSAFSEPETQAIKYFCEQNEFKIALNYHTYSDLLIYPWGYASLSTDDDEQFEIYASYMTQDNSYTYGIASTTIYEANGVSDDWMYGEQTTKPKILSYTPEVGGDDDGGFWPPSNKIIELCQENMLQNLMAARFVGKYASVTEKTDLFIPQEAHILFDIQRLGMDNSGSYTVILDAISSEITSTGDAIVFNNLDLLEISEDSISYTLTTEITNGTEIKFLLSIDNGNFIISDTISKIYGEALIVFSDNCTTDNNWNGQWQTTTATFFSSPASITDSPSGNYSNNENKSTILSDAIDLTDADFTIANLSFMAKWEIENDWDYVQLDVSINDGTSWEPLAGKHTNEGTGSSQPAGEPLYDGSQTNWVKEEINLDDYLGHNLLLKFTLVSDELQAMDGFYFDDIEVFVVKSSNILSENISDKAQFNLFAYPNPAKSGVSIKYNLPEAEHFGKLKIYDLLGNIVVDKHLNSDNQIYIPLHQFHSGVYFYQIVAGNKSSAIKKIIIE